MRPRAPLHRSAGKRFAGFTTQLYLGAFFEGRAGAHAACAAEFDSSHLCHGSEFLSANVAVRDPTLEELAEAARRGEYRVEVEPGAAHPRRPAKREGRILIVGGGNKTAILQAVAEELKAQRS